MADPIRIDLRAPHLPGGTPLLSSLTSRYYTLASQHGYKFRPGSSMVSLYHAQCHLAMLNPPQDNSQNAAIALDGFLLGAYGEHDIHILHASKMKEALEKEEFSGADNLLYAKELAKNALKDLNDHFRIHDAKTLRCLFKKYCDWTLEELEDDVEGELMGSTEKGKESAKKVKESAKRVKASEGESGYTYYSVD